MMGKNGEMSMMSDHNRPKEQIRRLGTVHDINPDSIKLLENKLGQTPSGVVIEVEAQGVRKEVFISRFVGSDPAEGLTEDWKTLSEIIALPSEKIEK